MIRGELKRAMVNEMKEQIAAEEYKLARLLTRKVFRLSPIWTGAYVGSHRVRLAGEFTSPPLERGETTYHIIGLMGSMFNTEVMTPQPHPDPEFHRERTMQEQLSKLARLYRTHRNQMFKRFEIINEAEDAQLVEFFGTLTNEGFVYTRTADTYRGWKSRSTKAKAGFE